MSSQYLIRFDDICPTMNWKTWEGIEKILNEFQVKPILAVVPMNEDEKLMVNPPNPKFWPRVRGWQANGWAIGLHGYKHLYVNKEPGIIGIRKQSEFSGLSETEQERKLQSAIHIFQEAEVKPKIWVAPSHSFDHTTVKVLHKIGIRSISDGFSIFPSVDTSGMFWIPQQMWRFRQMPFGVWTVCFHHNSWKERELGSFRKSISLFQKSITDVDSLQSLYGDRRIAWFDKVSNRASKQMLRLKAIYQLNAAVVSNP